MALRACEFKLGEREYVFRPPPHLRVGEDWHTAYVRIVDRLFDAGGKRGTRTSIPAYPLLFAADRWELTFELGAYWEGAIYCLSEKLDARDLRQGLADLERRAADGLVSTADQLFMAIWNSHGQLKWLKAHSIRERLLSFSDLQQDCPIQIRRLATAEKCRDLEWLAGFVDQHVAEGATYPNPYFGGTNPLHLAQIGPR